MSRTEIRVTGLGGQGVVLCGYVIGRACAIESGRHATMIQSFGPEARGSACSATLVVSDEEVLYPYVRAPDFLVAMSSEGYEKYKHELKPDGVLIYEKDLVHPGEREGGHAYGVPSTRIAEELGRLVVQNIVMLAFFTAVSGIAGRDEMRAAVRGSVPAGTEEFNLKAFDAGWAYYETHYGTEKDATRAEKAGSGAAD